MSANEPTFLSYLLAVQQSVQPTLDIPLNDLSRSTTNSICNITAQSHHSSLPTYCQSTISFPFPCLTYYPQSYLCQHQNLTSSPCPRNSFNQSTFTPSHHIFPTHLPFSPPPSLHPTSTDSRSCAPSGTACL